MIRIAVMTDLERVLQITESTILEVYSHYYPQGVVDFFLKHHSREYIFHDIEGGIVWLLEVDDCVVGTVTIKENAINRLFVLPEYQSHGYGSQLMDFAENKIAEKFSYIHIDSSLPAKEMYLKRGYKEKKTCRIEAANGDTLIYDEMEKLVANQQGRINDNGKMFNRESKIQGHMLKENGMTNEQILEIAMRQSALDSNCHWRDFMGGKNKVVISGKNENARKYLELPFICDLASYGSNIVASVSEELIEIVTEYINQFSVENCFETPNLHELMSRIRPLGYDVCFMAEYSLPDVDALLGAGLAERLQKTCPYEIRIMDGKGFQGCYTEQWSNALCEARKELDVIAAGAYHGDRLIGLAGASADCESMWQIGIDVLPEYRRQGIAAALTSNLAVEILDRGIVPFYCCAWSNIGSIRNAIASGFRPGWVQLTVKKQEKIAEFNREAVHI